MRHDETEVAPYRPPVRVLAGRSLNEVRPASRDYVYGRSSIQARRAVRRAYLAWKENS